MVKRILVLISFFAAVAGSVNAQMTYTPKSAYTELIAGTEVECRIKLTNEWTHDVQLSWRMISSTIKDFGAPGGAWLVQYCDCNSCRSNEFSPLVQSDVCADKLAPRASIDWYMKIDVGTVAIANAEWIIEVHNQTDNVYDTISYFLLDHPNSVKETSNNATVTSYPNPAKDVLTINYALTNVNTPVISVYSLIGLKVASFPLSNANGVFDINTSNLENGMYFYTIEEEGQRVFIQKFNVVH
jgi:hypothetical protein